MSTVATPAAGAAAGVPPKDRRRFAFIDACRGLAAAVIAAHHLCLYGPLPEAVASLATGENLFAASCGQFVELLREHGRYAVQVFLVLGGFVQYLTFPAGVLSLGRSGQIFWLRYIRLAVPLLAVLALGLLTHQVTAGLQPVTPYIDEFSLPHLVAQIFFVQDILGYGGLMPGHWYPAIDLQFALLFMAMVLLIDQVRRISWFARISRTAMFLTLGGALAIGSLFFWNRDSAYECWVLYFLGTYFLGILAATVLDRKTPLPLFWGFCVILGCALYVEPRVRLFVALGTAVTLLAGGLSNNLDRWLNYRWLLWLGKISYSFFLIHTLVHWLVLSLGHALTGTNPYAAIVWMLVAYALSIPAGWAFYQLVERPSLGLVTWWKTATQPLPAARESQGKPALENS